MNNTKDYESTEFYTYKFKNFSTMIIIPMAILVLLLFIGSVFATRENTVSSMGIIQPTQTLSIKNKDYQEGQVIKNDGRKWLIHLDDKNTNLAQLMPVIEAKKKVNLIVLI